jgi:hypothetical protein
MTASESDKLGILKTIGQPDADRLATALGFIHESMSVLLVSAE